MAQRSRLGSTGWFILHHDAPLDTFIFLDDSPLDLFTPRPTCHVHLFLIFYTLLVALHSVLLNVRYHTLIPPWLLPQLRSPVFNLYARMHDPFYPYLTSPSPGYAVIVSFPPCTAIRIALPHQLITALNALLYMLCTASRLKRRLIPSLPRSRAPYNVGISGDDRMSIGGHLNQARIVVSL